MLNLFLVNSDSFSGGINIEISKKINLEKYLFAGDLLIIGKNIKHSIEPIDKKKFNFFSKKENGH